MKGNGNSLVRRIFGSKAEEVTSAGKKCIKGNYIVFGLQEILLW
jgi:hypothetical protein